MATKTVLDFGAITSVLGTDIMYLTRGTGTTRDKQITLTEFFNTIPTATILGDLSVDKDQDGTTRIFCINENVSTGAIAQVAVKNDLGYLSLYTHSSARTAVRYGITLGGYAEISTTTGGNGLLIGTGVLAKPIYFGTNNALRLTIDSAGVLNIGASGVLQHNGTQIIDSSGNINTTKVITSIGNVTMSSGAQLLIQGDTGNNLTGIKISGTVPTLKLYETDDPANQNFQIRCTGGKFHIEANNDTFSTASLKLSIDQSGIINISSSGVLQHNGNQILDSSGNINLAAGLTITASKTSGTCIQGTATGAYAGVKGINNDSGGYGVAGTSTNGYGVYGLGTNSYGVYGISTNESGVYGTASGSGKAGIRGVNNTAGGFGVYGSSTSGYGGHFSSLNIDTGGALSLGTTPVLDSSRNLLNIGTIGCGTVNIASGSLLAHNGVQIIDSTGNINTVKNITSIGTIGCGAITTTAAMKVGSTSVLGWEATGNTAVYLRYYDATITNGNFQVNILISSLTSYISFVGIRWISGTTARFFDVMDGAGWGTPFVSIYEMASSAVGADTVIRLYYLASA